MKRIGSHRKFRFEFKLEDFWIGTFWKRKTTSYAGGYIEQRIDVWICLIPTLPLHYERVRWALQ